MSEKNPPEQAVPNLEAIVQAALAAGDVADSVSTEQRVEALEQRIASIEPLLEQLQADAELSKALTNYVSDLRAEQVFFNRARYVVGVFSFLAVVGLVLLLSLSIFHASSPLLAAPPLAIAAFVLGLVSAVAVLLNSFLKGVFRSTNERHADGYLPPALEKGVELMNKVAGRS